MKKKTIIRLDLSYNGSQFKGYQKQEAQRTVQGEIEQALKIIFKASISLYCAGRTDTGVHALHQVVSFEPIANIKIPLKKLHIALNALLPKDICILKVQQESTSFHARFSPKKRTYLYVIDTAINSSPFKMNYVWHCPQLKNWKKLKKALKYFQGEHHFGSFCEKPSGINLVRTIYNIKVKKKKNLLFIYISGNAFLRRMIRILIGTSVSIACRKDVHPSIIESIFAFQERNKNPFPTAPPEGLFFYKIEF